MTRTMIISALCLLGSTGCVVTTEGEGEKAVASIDFGSEGVKRLLLRYAPVEKL